jgi:uncharacterized protein YjbI with pentapeptide repeats
LAGPRAKDPHPIEDTAPGLPFVGLASQAWPDADPTDVALTGADLENADLAHVVWSDTTCPDGTNSDNDYRHICVHDLTLSI